jgi:tRNA threonylcarbamoyladenosine biosynthesis protein TsaE
MKNAHLTKEEFTCESAEETFALGEKIGAALKGGEVILLSGELGAGKTLLTKGILSALDYDAAEVTSPSFTLVNIYEARLKVFHIDLYRLDEKSDIAFEIGLDEILEEENAVVIIEWGERLKDFSFPRGALHVNIEGDGEEARRITTEMRM